MKCLTISCLAFLTVLIACHHTVPVSAIESKCSACKAVAAELQRRITLEKPRNHLDMRHRLDSTGQRYGKVISYKVSELRAVELMDNLCAQMKDYSLIKLNTSTPAALFPNETESSNTTTSSSSTGASASTGNTDSKPAASKAVKQATRHAWVRVRGAGADSKEVIESLGSRPPQQEEEARGKQLESYCGAVFEENEEEVYAGIMGGVFDESGVEQLLCSSITRFCPSLAAKDSKNGSTLISSSASAVDATEGLGEQLSADVSTHTEL